MYNLIIDITFFDYCNYTSLLNGYLHISASTTSPAWITLKDRYHQWMVENGIKYNISYEVASHRREFLFFKTPNKLKYFIIFENKNDAMLFKLAWIGT
jgi:hypothetical protein